MAMGVVELVIEGRDLESSLREMDKSGLITVVGPHIPTGMSGSGVDGHRIVIRVAAENAADARELVEQYLPPRGDYSIRPALA